MAREFTNGFYGRAAWKNLAKYYKKKVMYCERCMRNGEVTAGELVHHKIHLTPDNFMDITISLNEDNLELLCRNCHSLEHSRNGNGRYYFNDNGELVIREK